VKSLDRLRPRALAVVGPATLLALLLAGTDCQPPGGPEPTQPRGEPAAPYDGRAAQLFDDAIEPAAVGLAAYPPNPKGDPIFRERAQASETVARVRVQTVTADSVDGVPTYHVGLQTIDRQLAGRPLPDGRAEVSIASSSPAFGIAKTLDARLVGHTFIGFFHRFTSGDEPQLFWHLAPDSADVLAAVKEATLLGELSGR
jgi:hypothetical protein